MSNQQNIYAAWRRSLEEAVKIWQQGEPTYDRAQHDVRPVLDRLMAEAASSPADHDSCLLMFAEILCLPDTTDDEKVLSSSLVEHVGWDVLDKTIAWTVDAMQRRKLQAAASGRKLLRDIVHTGAPREIFLSLMGFLESILSAEPAVDGLVMKLVLPYVGSVLHRARPARLPGLVTQCLPYMSQYCQHVLFLLEGVQAPSGQESKQPANPAELGVVLNVVDQLYQHILSVAAPLHAYATLCSQQTATKAFAAVQGLVALCADLLVCIAAAHSAMVGGNFSTALMPRMQVQRQQLHVVLRTCGTDSAALLLLLRARHRLAALARVGAPELGEDADGWDDAGDEDDNAADSAAQATARDPPRMTLGVPSDSDGKTSAEAAAVAVVETAPGPKGAAMTPQHAAEQLQALPQISDIGVAAHCWSFLTMGDGNDGTVPVGVALAAPDLLWQALPCVTVLLSAPATVHCGAELLARVLRTLPPGVLSNELLQDPRADVWRLFQMLTSAIVSCPVASARMRFLECLTALVNSLSELPRFTLLYHGILSCPYLPVSALLLHALKQHVANAWDTCIDEPKSGPATDAPFLSACVVSLLFQVLGCQSTPAPLSLDSPPLHDAAATTAASASLLRLPGPEQLEERIDVLSAALNVLRFLLLRQGDVFHLRGSKPSAQRLLVLLQALRHNFDRLSQDSASWSDPLRRLRVQLVGDLLTRTLELCTADL